MRNKKLFKPLLIGIIILGLLIVLAVFSLWSILWFSTTIGLLLSITYALDNYKLVRIVDDKGDDEQ
ncbi:hypothetical protein [Priestia megaterium]|uniref:hypothetical protein n=1 Tax=Priestia megaterium TaxID=1404 RepID=UPI002E1FFA41|nr:hypothetical protein [Priestia megaterium]MED4278301.1 hypothetical protein [Priestia megaterium]MED4314406.1 hypothetical protein [Priestia megaterium]